MEGQAVRRPPRLRPGDRVAVVGPSGPVDQDRLEDGCMVLRSWGLDVSVAPHVGDVHNQFDYLAGADADRARDLEAVWLDPSVTAVLCARGGYGAQRVADLLDWEAMREARPKVFAGSSDVTALHQAFASRLGVATLYAPMVAGASFGSDERSAALLRQVLFEPEAGLVLRSSTAEILVPGTARGVTTGGCVTVLASSIGTVDGRRGAAGGILLLEDVGERRYRLDRAFTQLLRSGWLDGVAGVVLGSWQGCEDGVHDLVLNRFGGLGIPVVGEFGFGHGPSPATVPLGIPATLDATAATLSFDVTPLV